ncbi:MAG TPA: hypothetical protein IAA05_10700 [Candidatus Blautia excrementipullorum]|nr:hypothetical protein [Candidatus Blautia excrementipullorum]
MKSSEAEAGQKTVSVTEEEQTDGLLPGFTSVFSVPGRKWTNFIRIS